MRGTFITFEGGEGAGKSTQLRAVGPRLAALGYDVLTTREPGGSPGAEMLREVLLFGKADLSLRAEILAHFAARCDHVDQVIRPALGAGKIVLCDRFYDSTLAYQGYGRADGDPAILQLISTLTGMVGLVPDLTILFEVSPETGRQRAALRAAAGATTGAVLGAPTGTSGPLVPDRYERADEAFHARVAQGFDALATAHPQRFARLSSEAAQPEAITDHVVERITAFLKDR